MSAIQPISCVRAALRRASTAVWLVAMLAISALAGIAARADPPPEEVALTEQQIFRYIESLKSPSSVHVDDEVDRLMTEASKSAEPNLQMEIERKLREAQERFAKASGFSSYKEYADVGHTFGMLAATGGKPEVGSNDWETDVERSIAEIEANKAMGQAEKKELIASMRAVMSTIKKPRFPENAQLYLRLKPRIDSGLAEVDAFMSERMRRRARPEGGSDAKR